MLKETRCGMVLVRQTNTTRRIVLDCWPDEVLEVEDGGKTTPKDFLFYPVTLEFMAGRELVEDLIAVKVNGMWLRQNTKPTLTAIVY